MNAYDILEFFSTLEKHELNYWKGAIEAMIVKKEAMIVKIEAMIVKKDEVQK